MARTFFKPQRRPRSRLLVEMLEDRRVLSASALETIAMSVVSASESAAQLHTAVESAVTSLADLVTARPEAQLGPGPQVTERLLENLPQHVIQKHPLLENVNIPTPTSPVDGLPTNPGNGNSGNGNSGSNNSGSNPGKNNPGNGTPTRPDRPATPPVVGTPTGPEPGAVDRPDRAERPGTPDVAAPIAELKLTFTPDGGEVNVRSDALAPTQPAAANQQTGAAGETGVVAVDATTRLVQESAEAGVRPTGETAVAEDEITAELIDQIVYLEAAAANAVPGELQGADLAALTGGGIDLRALDEALRQAVATVERAGQAVVETVARPGWTTWVVGALGSLLAVEGLRRTRRRRARVAGAVADDAALTWVPGMPGSLSVEDA